MGQLGSLVQSNWPGIVIGVIVTLAAGVVVRVCAVLFAFVKKFGVKQLGQALLDAVVHVEAYQKIKADPVLTTSYIAVHLAAMIMSATVFLTLVLLALSGVPIPLWLRVTLGILASVFGARALKRQFAIFAFYSATAGPVITEVENNNFLVKAFKRRKKGEPFFKFEEPATSAQPDTKVVTALPKKPAPPPPNPRTIEGTAE